LEKLGIGEERGGGIYPAWPELELGNIG